MPIYSKKNISQYQKIGVWKISESTEKLKELSSQLAYDVSPPESKNEDRVKQWLATRLLLNHFFKNEEILYNKLGKPYLCNGWNISISHSTEFVAILINKKEDCGIDIEKISSKVERIKKKFLSENDLKKVHTLKDLTTYWGAKEALYKYYGKKEVLFIENLFIENFTPYSNNFKGIISMPELKKELSMKWEEIEDSILVYTL